MNLKKNLARGAFLLFLVILAVPAICQQRYWALPTTGPSGGSSIAYVDFAGPAPVYTTRPFAGRYSTQTTGNGEYCNSCSSHPGNLSEFYISGITTYGDYNPGGGTIGGGYKPVGINYEQICGPNVTDVFEADCGLPGTEHLAHESLAEVAMGAGEERGTFWALFQDADNPTGSGSHNGNGMQLYLLDFNNPDMCSNLIIDIDAIMFAELGVVHQYNEGVAMGPRFTYDATVGSLPLGGRICRSLYFSTTDVAGGALIRHYHCILDVDAQTVYYSGFVTNDTDANQNLETDLSFPDALNNDHPRWIIASGFSGITMVELDENGDFVDQNGDGTLGVSDVHRITGIGAGVEFDVLNNYVYYSHFVLGDVNVELYRMPLTAFSPGTIGAPSGTWIATIPQASAGYQYTVLETASNNKIYILGNGSWWEIADPSNPTPTAIGLSDQTAALSSVYPIDSLGRGLPDWVDGEDPLEVQEVFIEICINTFDCSETDSVRVDVLADTVLIETVFITPGGCDRVYVCPDVTYTIDVNNGEHVDNNVYVIQDYISFDYTVGSVTGLGGIPTATVVTDFIIDSDEFWTGTIIVPDDIQVTNGAVLDVTNADVIFHPCTGITFDQGARLRANNSVWRPCIETDVWDGLHFIDSRDNKFNENTIKNAVFALHYEGNSDGNISENLFYNCMNGVRTENIQGFFEYAINANSFTVDDRKPDYTACEIGLAGTNSGIVGINTAFRGNISQNTFINSIELITQQTMGVVFSGTSGSISGNNFRNMYRAVEAIGGNNQSVVIENNTIEAGLIETNHNHQIVIDGIQAQVTIYNNTLVNPETLYQTVTESAIYVANSTAVDVRANNIEGFLLGVFSITNNIMQVANNEMRDIRFVGIFGIGAQGNHIDVSCNDITLDNLNQPVTAGIVLQDVTGLSTIHSNCVKSTHYGIYCFTNQQADLPLIRNNFVYNYTTAGIFSQGYFGNIGTSADPGMNTLYSNNNSAADIAAVGGPIQVANNFGMFNITFPSVQITQNNPYHSVANCATQIYSMPSQGNLNSNLVCERFLELQGLRTTGQTYTLIQSADETLNRIEATFPEQFFEVVAAVQLRLGSTEGEVFYNAALQHAALNPTQKQWLSYYYATTTDDATLAEQMLNSISPTSAEEEDALFLEKLRFLHSYGLLEKLPVADQQQLLAIIGANGRFANEARVLWRILTGEGDYLFKALQLAIPEIGNTIFVQDHLLQVYPNPAATELNIVLAFADESSYTVSLHDLSGREVYRKEANLSVGLQTIDVSELKAGTYIVTVQNEEGILRNTRFVKL